MKKDSKALPQIAIPKDDQEQAKTPKPPGSPQSSVPPSPSTEEKNFTGIVSHNIPHVLETVSLVIPVVCVACDRFIWGLNKKAITCAGESKENFLRKKKLLIAYIYILTRMFKYMAYQLPKVY